MNSVMSEPLIADDEKPEELERIPHWRDQITARGLIVSGVLGCLFCVISHKLSLTVGIIPSLNIAAGLLGFFFIRSWTGFASKLGFSVQPFTRQENTVIQTCVVACYGLATSGGFGSYILAMDEKTYQLIGVDYLGNRSQDVKNPSLVWMTSFLFIVSFIGLFCLVPLRKIMIMKYKLTYPSGTATAILINSFHTSTGSELASKQVNCLGKYLGISLCWSCFKWFFSGIGDSCGFDNFPSLGMTLFKNSFYFDFNLTYIGCGLICPHIVSFSCLLGAIISWGLLWPFISWHAGDWYPADLGSNDFKGLYGYKVFIAISIILGDGIYNLIKIVSLTVNELVIKERVKSHSMLPHMIPSDQQRDIVFLRDGIPWWVAGVGYTGLTILSTATIPILFPQLKWYLVLTSYIFAPLLAFCNSYGTGLTDWNLESTYGKLCLFVFSSIVGSNGGVIAGLAACGVMMSIVSTAADLMQDFKTGYLTFSSPKSMFLSQLVGTIMGCLIAPLTFWLFWVAFDIGSPHSQYKAPYAVIFRQLAVLGVSGFSQLPRHCLELCCAFFVSSVGINVVRDLAPRRFSRFLPIPMVMAIPFYIGAYFTIDMFVGTVILYVWEVINRKGAEDYATSVAAGFICGDGVWAIPSAVFSIFKITPPICMSFRPSSSL